METNRASKTTPSPFRDKGFTLIELMIVVLIIGIISAIAYPTYRGHMMRSHRAEGKALLVDAAARQERFYSNGNPALTYTTNMVALNFGDVPEEFVTERYELTATGCPIGSCFTLQVEAINGQQQDTDCRFLTFNSVGQRGARDSSNNPTTDVCW